MGKFKRFRSAITGLFVTKKEAENNPKTTVQETVYDYATNEVLDSYARDLDYEDFDELVRETSKFKLKEHFLLIIKSLKK